MLIENDRYIRETWHPVYVSFELSGYIEDHPAKNGATIRLPSDGSGPTIEQTAGVADYLLHKQPSVKTYYEWVRVEHPHGGCVMYFHRRYSDNGSYPCQDYPAPSPAAATEADR